MTPKERLGERLRRIFDRSRSPTPSEPGRSTSAPAATASRPSSDKTHLRPDTPTSTQSTEPVLRPSSRDVQTTSSPVHHSSSVPVSLWGRALALLKEDRTTRKLLQTYERLLIGSAPHEEGQQPSTQSERGSVLSTDASPEEWHQRLTLLAAQARNVEREEGPVGSALKAVLENVDSVKDVITFATSFEPHAAMAWSGVCFILPVQFLEIQTKANY